MIHLPEDSIHRPDDTYISYDYEEDVTQMRCSCGEYVYVENGRGSGPNLAQVVKAWQEHWDLRETQTTTGAS